MRLMVVASLVATLLQTWVFAPGALAADVELTPSSYDFGSVEVGASSISQTLTFTNNINGSGTQFFSIAILPGPPPNDFVIVANNCTGILGVGNSCSFAIQFAPTVVGTRTAAIAISATSGEYSATLTGTGTAASAPTTLSVAPAMAVVGGEVALSATLTESAGGGALAGQIVDFALNGTPVGSATTNGSGVATLTAPLGAIEAGVYPAGIQAAFAGGDGYAASDGTAQLVVIQPSLDVTPSSLVFGEQAVGTTSTSQTITLTNSGTVWLNDVSIGATGNFAQSNNCPATLLVGESCTINVTFAPTATGAASGTLTVASDAASSPDSVTLSGTGVAPLAPLVTLSSTSLGFGEQQVGTTSVAQTVTLTNTGTAALTIISVALSDGGQFLLGAEACSGQTIAPNQGCTIAVSFAPTTSGAKSGSLTVASDAVSSPESVALSGTGAVPPPALTLTPTSIAFGEQAVGTTGAGQRVTVSNSGGGVLSVGTPGLLGAGAVQFTLGANGCVGAELAAAESCDFSVLFGPAITGAHEATVSVPSNAATGSVALTGTGVAPALDVAPSTLAFGSQTVGTTSAAHSVTITNVGSGPGLVESAAIGGGFAIASDACAGVTLAPNASCAIAVTFAPVAIGPASGSLIVGGATVGLGGTGVAAPVATTLAVAPVGGTYGGIVTLAATLRDSGSTAPIAGKVIAFTVGGSPVGTATTDDDGVATLPGVALGARAAGSYPNAVGASFAGDGGMLASGGTADLTVARATLTITAQDQERAYGFANPPLTLAYGGFVNGDTAASLTGRATVSTTATATSNVGSYPIAAARNTLNSPNYDFVFVNGRLTVSPTPLTIAAVDKTRGYGAANPALTLRYTGFRQGDNAADLGGAPSLTTTATPASPAGAYPIVVGRGAVTSPNYSYTFVDGTLTVNPANVALSAVSGAATYGGTATLMATLRQTGSAAAPIAGATVAFTLGGAAVGSATTDGNGVATLANVALGGRGAGNYGGLVGASFAGNGNQAGDTATGALRVAKAAIVLRAVDLSRPVGADNPPCQVQLAPGSAFVNGDTLASLDLANFSCNYGGANRRASAGQYALTPRGARSDNYAITYQGGTLTVTQ